MSGAGGQEVGRISVRVVPNTDGFRAKLKSQLERETAGLDAEAEVGVKLRDGDAARVVAEAESVGDAAQAAVEEITARLDLDTSRFLTEFQATLAAAEAALANIDSHIDIDQAEFLAGIEAMADTAEQLLERVEAGFDVNQGEFLAQVQAMAQAAQYALENLSVELTPQAAGFIEAVQGLVEIAEAAAGAVEIPVRLHDEHVVARAAALARAAEAAAGAINLRVSADRDGFLRQVRALQSEAQGLANRLAPRIPIGINGDRARRQMELLVQYINGQVRRLSETTDIDVSRRLAGNVQEATRRLREMGGEVDRNNTRWSGFGAIMSKVGNGLANVASNIRLSGHSLLILVAVMTLLAPLLAIVSGTLITLPGLIAGAGVAAAAAALSFEGIKEAAKVLDDEFKELKQVMTDAGKTEFLPVFLQLEHLFPRLKASLPGVTQGLSDMAMGFAQAVTSEPGLNNIQNTIDNVAKSLSMAQPGVRDFTEGILNLVSKISDRFPGLATIFNNLGAKFEEWVMKMTTIDDKGSTPLDRVLTQMKEISKGIGDFLGGLFGSGTDMLTDEDMGTKIKDFLADLETFITESIPTFIAAFNLLAAAMSGVADSIDEIKVSWDELKGAFSGDGFGEFFTNMGLPEEFTIDFGAIGDLWNSFEQAMVQGWNEIDWSWFTGAGLQEKLGLNDLFEGWTIDWYTLLSANAIVGAVNTIVTNIDRIINKLKEWFGLSQELPEVGSDKGTEGWDGTGLNGGGKLFSGLDQQLNELEQVPQRIEDAKGAIRGALESLDAETMNTMPGGNAEGGAANPFSEIPAQAEAAFGQLPAIAGSAFNQIPGLAQGAVAVITAAFIVGANSWIQAFQFAGESIVGIVSAWPGLILGALGDLSGLLYSAGVEIANGLANGITAGTPAAVAAAQSMAAQVAAAARSALDINSPSRVMHEIGEYTSEGFANGITAGASGPATAMTQMIEGLDVDTSTTLDSILGKVSAMTADMVNQIEDRQGTVNVSVNIGTINANQIEQVANQVEKSNSKIASSADKAAKAQEKVYGKLDTEGKKASDELSAQGDELDAEIARLELLAETTTNKKAKADLEARIKALEIQEKELAYKKKAIEYENKYGESLESAVKAAEAQSEAAEETGLTLAQKIERGLRNGMDGITGAIADIIDAIGEEFGQEDFSTTVSDLWDESEMKDLPETFATDTKNQFFSDLGISGNGAISKAIEEIPTYIFNVNNMDEALSAKDRETNKNSLKYTSR